MYSRSLPGPSLIAGPCAVDEHIEPTLEAVAELGVTWARGGAWKPRTFPWSFQGEGLAALRRLRACADRLGMKVVSEVVSEVDLPAAAELVDVVQVGARNCQNFALLKLLAGAGKPVLLKRGAACTVEEWLGAAEYLEGRVPVTLCERGIRGFDPYIERRPICLRTQTIHVGQCGRTPMASNTRERNLLLDRDAEVCAVEHERQVVERRREHGVRKCRHDRRPGLTRARARAGRLYLVSPLAGDSNDVADGERRRQRLRVLGSCVGGR